MEAPRSNKARPLERQPLVRTSRISVGCRYPRLVSRSTIGPASAVRFNASNARACTASNRFSGSPPGLIRPARARPLATAARTAHFRGGRQRRRRAAVLRLPFAWPPDHFRALTAARALVARHVGSRGTVKLAAFKVRQPETEFRICEIALPYRRSGAASTIGRKIAIAR